MQCACGRSGSNTRPAPSASPAVSWGIVHDLALIASGAFGEANPADDQPATTETLYSICSISKLFTSIGLMQQREAGNVRLDGAVSDYLDWFDIEEARGILENRFGPELQGTWLPLWNLMTFGDRGAAVETLRPLEDSGNRHEFAGFLS